MCAQPIRSQDGSETGAGASPGGVQTTHRVGQERRAGRDGGELRGELAVAQVQRAVPDQTEGGGIPERSGAAVAEHYLVALG